MSPSPKPHLCPTESWRSKACLPSRSMPEITYLEAIREALFEEMERDPSVFLMGEDVGHYGGAVQASAGLLEKFGEKRGIDTPLAEAALVGAGVGAAMMGMRPVIGLQFIDFISNGFNQIVNMAANI